MDGREPHDATPQDMGGSPVPIPVDAASPPVAASAPHAAPPVPAAPPAPPPRPRRRPRLRRWPLVLGLAATLAGGGIAALGPEPTRAAPLLDRDGRVLVMRGFNTDNVTKSAIDGMPATTPEQVAREQADMASTGVRLLMSWRAIEPTPGTIDTAYLDRLEERVAAYHRLGQRVLLDMHQDVYGFFGATAQSPTFGSGEFQGNGAPAWASHSDGLRLTPQTEMWELGYLEPGVMRAFDHFWGTTGEHTDLQDHYVNAWRAVAQRFTGNPAVIGYDLMNEPYGGTLQGPRFESGPLTALYQRLTTTIRQVDPDSWICLEPQAMGVNWGTHSGLRKVADPRPGPARIAYCPHLYPLPIDLGGAGYTGSGKQQVDVSLALWRNSILRTAHDLGDVPVILGEFGLDTTTPGALDYLATVTRMVEEMGGGWIYWSRDPGSWGPYTEDGQPRNLADLLAEPSPVAVAGRDISWENAPDRLELTWQPDTAVRAATLVRVPTTTWPARPTVSGARITGWDAATGTLELAPPDGWTTGKVTAIVTPGS